MVNGMNACLLFLLGIIPRQALPTATVELIERNHVYDDEGRPGLCQVLLWNDEIVAWDATIGWKDNRSCVIEHRPGYTLLVVVDRGIVRAVRARTFGESWLQWDVELQRREIVPPDRRERLAW